jgi:uncharacterized membrane protein YkvA (DUF1232 family)
MFKRIISFIRAYPKLVADPKVPAKAKYLPWIALAYLIIPTDIIPDFFMMLGQLDDVAVILTLLLIAARAFEQSPTQKEKKKYGDVIEVEAVKK